MFDIYDDLRRRLDVYADLAGARQWFQDNFERCSRLFGDLPLLEMMLQPIRDVFEVHGKDRDSEICAVITRVAVANAVLAGLPGKMGVGVFVSMGLEAWMAYEIAIRSGVSIKEPADIWKYFTMLAAVGGTIVYGFRLLLGVFFSTLSFLPWINPLIPAELFVTDLVGILFWTGFTECARTGSFAVPTTLYGNMLRRTQTLFSSQWGALTKTLSPDNLKSGCDRLVAWFSGDIPVLPGVLMGEYFVACAMAAVLRSEQAALDGPLGKEFVEAIRDRFPTLANAGIEQIGDHMRQYSDVQMGGVISVVKGRLFERLVMNKENTDADSWQVLSHKDMNHPGSDLILVNPYSGESVEISLKATDNPAYVEEALVRYPDIPVMTTEEIAAHFKDDPRIQAGPFLNERLVGITQENFDRMLDTLTRAEIAGGLAIGEMISITLNLWPFMVAYCRGNIGMDQISTACERLLGESGKALASRLAYGIALGPIAAWFFLARGILILVKTTENIGAAERDLKRMLTCD